MTTCVGRYILPKIMQINDIIVIIRLFFPIWEQPGLLKFHLNHLHQTCRVHTQYTLDSGSEEFKENLGIFRNIWSRFYRLGLE